MSGSGAGRASRQAQGSVSIVTASDGAIGVPGWPEHDGPEHGRAARARSAWPPDPGDDIAAAGQEYGQEGQLGVSGGPGTDMLRQPARAAPGAARPHARSASSAPAGSVDSLAVVEDLITPQDCEAESEVSRMAFAAADVRSGGRRIHS